MRGGATTLPTKTPEWIRLSPRNPTSFRVLGQRKVLRVHYNSGPVRPLRVPELNFEFSETYRVPSEVGVESRVGALGRDEGVV